MTAGPELRPRVLFWNDVDERDEAVEGARERPVLMEALRWRSGQTRQHPLHRDLELLLHAARSKHWHGPSSGRGADVVPGDGGRHAAAVESQVIAPDRTVDNLGERKAVAVSIEALSLQPRQHVPEIISGRSTRLPHECPAEEWRLRSLQHDKTHVTKQP